MKGRPVQKTRGAALLAATALVMSGLAACGDEGGTGEASSTASPSAAGSGSSETSGSSDGSSSGSEDTSSSAGGDGEVAELPEAATKKTKAGAIAFNEFYWEQRGEALETGSTDTLREFSDPDCEPCTAYIDTTEKNARRGVTMNNNPNNVKVTNASKRSDGGYKVTIRIKADEYHEVMSDGGTGRTADAITFNVVTDTQWAGGHWTTNDSVVSDSSDSADRS